MMEKTTHTPGPWAPLCKASITTCQHPPIMHDRGQAAVATWQGSEAATDANARLIAAAPELLGELVKITDAYAEAMKDAGVTHYPEALVVVRQARAAIAKAGGE